jgi:hypothetical protein
MNAVRHHNTVIPAQAGIHTRTRLDLTPTAGVMDPRLRGDDSSVRGVTR